MVRGLSSGLVSLASGRAPCYMMLATGQCSRRTEAETIMPTKAMKPALARGEVQAGVWITMGHTPAMLRLMNVGEPPCPRNSPEAVSGD